VFVSDFNNRRLTVAILTLSDKRLIETDLLKIGFLFGKLFMYIKESKDGHIYNQELVKKL
jgi:hypothetical protein